MCTHFLLFFGVNNMVAYFTGFWNESEYFSYLDKNKNQLNAGTFLYIYTKFLYEICYCSKYFVIELERL